MKYLKKYESLDSSKRERNLRFLGDMSFELGDDGFNVEVISYDDFGLGDIIVRINKKSKPSPLGMYVHNLIPVKLKGEELYLEYRPEQRVDYSIGQLVIKFK